MRAHDKVEVYDVFKKWMMQLVYELFFIVVINREAEAMYIESKYTLERVFRGDNIY